MGKGFHNYMSKKFFHPGSFENIKKVWVAQQKDSHDKKAQEDMLTQYQKEQEQYHNRALLGDEKAKVGLTFMYDPPPGVKREREREEDEPEYKFEWQRKYNAPRENYAKGDDAVRDQPFGIEVRNVRCLKCRKWGHINTDKICPLFGQSITAEPPQPGSHPGELMEQMADEGLAFTKKVLSRQNDPNAENQKMIDTDDEDDEQIQFFLALSRKEKKKLIKQLEKKRRKEKKTKRKMKQKAEEDKKRSSSEEKLKERRYSRNQGETKGDRELSKRRVSDDSHNRRDDHRRRR